MTFSKSSSWFTMCTVMKFIIVGILLSGCQLATSVSQKDASIPTKPSVEVTETEAVTTPTPQPTNLPDALADILSVEVTGSDNAYRFAVRISSPDTGCDQYADWWEVISEDGTLLYRRILAHSHRDEQPFVRSGGPVELADTTTVIIRAHMNPSGYGGQVMKGSIQNGFAEIDLSPDFADQLESEPPLPDGCAF